ncbi:lipase family protein [Tahibacter soli]|uniref:Fungal lipase-type domain-containing protein n=1 Tax=Tahibacter soli TaxID=2983605 RepID=A0A9X4BH23_9GAMM|nr:hypothetical protein [Tahibacter soli]MDC8011833.1 hypothetical protein [Tahibacter soli]
MTLVFTPGGDAVAAVGVTLASMAYAADRETIANLLADASLSTGGAWSLAWYAADSANQVYVAQDASTGQYAIAIRGSITDPHSEAFWDDWFKQDLRVFKMTDWTYGGAPDGAKISNGSNDGLASLIGLVDTSLNQTLQQFFAANAPTQITAVVGHSLGGALATVLAPWLQQQFSSAPMFWPVTYAGPTAGNAVFAGWLESDYAMTTNRYFNVNDVVPHGWWDVDWIKSSFQSTGPYFPLELVPFVDAINELLIHDGDDYTQPGAGTALTNPVVVNISWFADAGDQHSCSGTYVPLCGAVSFNNGSSGN